MQNIASFIQHAFSDDVSIGKIFNLLCSVVIFRKCALAFIVKDGVDPTLADLYW